MSAFCPFLSPTLLARVVVLIFSLPLLAETILIARDCLLGKVSLFFFKGPTVVADSLNPFELYRRPSTLFIDRFKAKYCFCEVSKICDGNGLKLNAPDRQIKDAHCSAHTDSRDIQEIH